MFGIHTLQVSTLLAATHVVSVLIVASVGVFRAIAQAPDPGPPATAGWQDQNLNYHRGEQQARVTISKGKQERDTARNLENYYNFEINTLLEKALDVPK